MAVTSAPTNLVAEQSDGNIALTWTAPTGAISYKLQRSIDYGATWLTIATLFIPQYLDSLPGVGIMFFYRVIATNGSGDSTPSDTTQMVAAPPGGEMSLYELRLRSQQCSDFVNNPYITTSEWNSFIRLAMYELYDLLITTYEDYFSGSNVYIQTNGTLQSYPIPDGYSNYFGGTYPSTGSTNPAGAMYKLVGVDLGVNTSNNAWVTLKRFDFIMRNSYVYPNSTSTIYGVYNMRYRMMANGLDIIPTPAGNQQIRLRYAPKLRGLLQDQDITNIGYSGWLRYVIVRAAKYALDKEESDTSKLDGELGFLKARIEQSASNRDVGQADTISETRSDNGMYGGGGFGDGGGSGGW